MSFDDENLCPDQEFELQRDPTGDIEYGVKYVVLHIRECKG